jgi:hypothetical protein
VHVSAGEAKLVTVLMHSNQLMWAGLKATDVGTTEPNPWILGRVWSSPTMVG